MKWDNYRAKVYQKDEFRIILRLQPRLQRLQPNALMVKKISAGIITAFNGNETDPGSSDEKPYKFMALTLQVRNCQEWVKRRNDMTTNGTIIIK